MPSRHSGFHIIYRAIAPNGKSYIGYTAQRLSDRITQHLYEASKGTKRPFMNAIRKYGKHIKWEIVAAYQTKEYALNRESYFIQKFNSTKNGYNAAPGGIARPKTDKKLSRRRKIIDNFGNIYSYSRDASEKLNIPIGTIQSAILFGYWCGPYFFEYYKPGMKTSTPNKPRTREIINLSDGTVYKSITEASKKLGIPHQSIYRVCKGGSRLQVRGNYFCYLENVEDRKQELLTKRNIILPEAA